MPQELSLHKFLALVVEGVKSETYNSSIVSHIHIGEQSVGH